MNQTPSQVTVGVDGRDPVVDSLDSGPDWFGDRGADREPDVQVVLLAQGPDVGEETVAGTGRIAAQQDRGAVPDSVGDLGQGLVQDGDVVSSGVRARLALTQHAGEGFARVVQEAKQRTIAEGLFQIRVADFFSEWQITIVASMSRTRPSTCRPATFTVGRSLCTSAC